MFLFSLDPVDEIEPWTSGDETDPSSLLTWYALSLGKYGIRVEEKEILRYSDEAISAVRVEYPLSNLDPQVHYQVSRLHEELLKILSEVLSPVPEQVARILRVETAVATIVRAEELRDEFEDDDPREALIDDVLEALAERQLDTAFLSPGPLVLFWRDADVIHVEWNGDGDTICKSPAWKFTSGHEVTSADRFLEEVRAFHQSFSREMSSRVTAVKQAWARPEVSIDHDGLAHAQQCCEQLLDQSLARPPAPTNWETVAAGLADCWPD